MLVTLYYSRNESIEETGLFELFKVDSVDSVVYYPRSFRITLKVIR